MRGPHIGRADRDHFDGGGRGGRLARSGGRTMTDQLDARPRGRRLVLAAALASALGLPPAAERAFAQHAGAKEAASRKAAHGANGRATSGAKAAALGRLRAKWENFLTTR